MAGAASALTPETLRQRANGSAAQHYVSIFAVMQGLVLAMAALVFPEMIRQREIAPLLLWCVGIEASVLTTHANAVGTILLEGIPGLHDTLLPILLSITHFLMFAVLRSPETVPYWNWAFGSFALSAFVLITGIIRRLRRANYEPRIASLVSSYVEGQRRDTFGAAANAAIFFSYAAITVIEPSAEHFQAWLGLTAAILLIIPIAHNRRAGHIIANALTGRDPAETAAP